MVRFGDSNYCLDIFTNRVVNWKMEGFMRLERIHIKGFRNYDDSEIVFQKKSLIIGANDVGKSNLLYALRLMFDKSISESGLELNDSDFNAYTETDTVEITVSIVDVVEECLISTFSGALKDGKVIIKYVNRKQASYQLFWGYSEETLSEIPSRQYIKRLNMQYLDANRNLISFMNKERSKMLQLSKGKRISEEIDADESVISQIQTGLNEINGMVNSLKYIASSLEAVNDELAELSIHNENQEVKFVSGDSKADEMLDNLVLSYSTEQGPLAIGGDGRNNQIFLATWIAKQKIQNNIDHVTFYAIEEPEAHLHPHQQRKLSEYIQNHFDGQVFVTSHSPQIVSRFDPANIIRLYSVNKNTYAACGGCSSYIKRVFDNFGYRLNNISAETFFSDGVFLVEGTSEVLLYTAVCNKLGYDLDRLNISILSVEGIGFKPYVAVCKALNIPWVLRTDNDIFSKPNNSPTLNYYAGISRVVGIVTEVDVSAEDALNYWNANKELNEWSVGNDPSQESCAFNQNIRSLFGEYGLYLSNVDLENDLATSSLQPILMTHYGKRTTNTLVKAMQQKKVENMLSFLEENEDSLTVLTGDRIMAPIEKLIKCIEERIRPNGSEGAN